MYILVHNCNIQLGIHQRLTLLLYLGCILMMHSVAQYIPRILTGRILNVFYDVSRLILAYIHCVMHTFIKNKFNKFENQVSLSLIILLAIA